jgi:hypothetical protein
MSDVGGLVEFAIFLAVLVVVVLTVAFGWDRYKSRQSATPSAGLQPTTEMFIDPETGKRQRVWYDPTTGKREYHDEP